MAVSVPFRRNTYTVADVITGCRILMYGDVLTMNSGIFQCSYTSFLSCGRLLCSRFYLERVYTNWWRETREKLRVVYAYVIQPMKTFARHFAHESAFYVLAPSIILSLRGSVSPSTLWVNFQRAYVILRAHCLLRPNKRSSAFDLSALRLVSKHCPLPSVRGENF